MDRSALFFDLVSILFLTGIWKISGQRMCPRLQKPWNGRFIGGCNRNIGSECRFDCRDPYRLVGSRIRVCRADGSWSGRPSSCELDGSDCINCNNCNNCDNGDSTCPALYYPVNGFTDGQCTPGLTGQSCNFHCNAGFALEGPSFITCLENNMWSMQTPQCRRTSGAICEDFVIPNGEAGCVIEGGITVCTVTCDPGFMLVGPSYITCTPSGWSEQFPSCRRGSPEVSNICPSLVAPSGGRLVGSCDAANSGDTCQLVCVSGYRPSDTRVLICQANGQWSSSLPRCISNGCPAINVPNGILTGSCNSGIFGDTCIITCQSGFTLTGNPTLTCQANGQWSGNVPTCSVGSCPVLPQIANGGSSGSCSPGTVGQTCNYFCNNGFRLVGQATLVCGNDGRWSGNPPQCTAGGCPSLFPPSNGVFSGSCSQSTVGQSCTFTCQPGFTLIGQAVLFCQNGGVWSSSPPTCATVASCPALNPPTFGGQSGTCRQASVGQSCSFSCQAGYTLIGPQILYCQAGGQWTGSPPTCTRVPAEIGTCAVLTPPPHGYFQECDNRLGGQCIVVCEQGYVRAGSRVRTCLGQGTWSGIAPICTRRVGYTTTYTYKVVPLWSLVFG